jgi:hypothetical protein
MITLCNIIIYIYQYWIRSIETVFCPKADLLTRVENLLHWLVLVSCSEADEICGRRIQSGEPQEHRVTQLSWVHRTTVFLVAQQSCHDQLHELDSAAGLDVHVGVVN